MVQLEKLPEGALFKMGLIPRTTLIGYEITGGAFVYGKWSEGTEAMFTFQASVQPLRAREMEMLPEARRNGASYRLYTNRLMRTVEQDGQNPDLVEIEEEKYEVYSRSSWKNNIIPHYKYVVIKLDIAEKIEPEINIVPYVDVHYSMLRQLIPTITGGHGGSPAP